MPEVGDHPGPIDDAALSSRQSKLRLAELAFGVAHPTAPGLVELWVCGAERLDQFRVGTDRNKQEDEVL